MKIIAGKYKGRKLVVSKEEFRPTTAKTKEGIFSILTSGNFLKEGKSVLEEAVVLDLFAGSAALSFESLSRGATKAIVIEINQNNLNSIKENALKLGVEKDVVIIKSDAVDLPKAKLKCNIVFVDPPYNSNLLEKSLQSLIKQNWLADEAIVVVEVDNTEKNNIPDDYLLLTERNYGKSKILILQYNNV
ncbi:MAG: 16S rRNA (guanine(966)-N(2))-methyltransferase RsmD [Alphaproteobacteria bacterium]